MSEVDVRRDLIRGLLQSCYVIEASRTGLQRRWGGDFDRDAERTAQRTERMRELLDAHGFATPDGVVEHHTAWFEALCGTTPTDIPLGAAVLHNFGKWATVYAGPYLGDDRDDFVALGKEHTRVELEIRTMLEDEAILPSQQLPDGRRFAILTDVHVGSAGRDELLRIAVDEINEIDPEFVVLPGDVTEDGEPEQFQLAAEILGGLACPYYAVPGNHDAIQRSTREPHCEEFWTAAFGQAPTDHVVDCGELQVALVDSADPTPSPFPDWDMQTGRMGEGIAAGVDSGALREGQIEALADRLDRSRPTLLIQHHELHPFPGFPPVKFALREEDAAHELETLSGHDLVGVVAGHTHRSAVLPVGNDSVTQLEIPALKDWPFAYSVVGVSDKGAQVVAQQVGDRDAVWSRSKSFLPLLRGFMLSPISDLAYTFRF